MLGPTMRILHIGKYYPPDQGGMERHVCDLATEQVANGHQVHVLCYHGSPGIPRTRESDNGIEITRLHVRAKISFAPLAPGFARELHLLCQEFHPHVIHVHLPNPAVLFTMFFPANIPLVVHWHADVGGNGSTNRFVRMAYPAYALFERAMLRRANAIIATSLPYLEYSPHLRNFRDKCTVIPLGIRPKNYSYQAGIDVPQTSGSPSSMVFSLGRFTFYKGFEYLVRAAQQLPQTNFVIAGEGETLPAIRKLVHELGLEHQVLLPGAISHDHMVRLMNDCTLFCLSSIDRGEAFGIVLLEAMLFGKPLISTDIPGSGTGWVNQHEQTGLVVPPMDAPALAKAIQRILKNPELATQYGQAAKRRFDTTFDLSVTMNAVYSVYEQAMGISQKS